MREAMRRMEGEAKGSSSPVVLQGVTQWSRTCMTMTSASSSEQFRAVLGGSTTSLPNGRALVTNNASIAREVSAIRGGVLGFG
jgi:hypothetical protein